MLPLFALALASQLMQGYAKDRTDSAEMSDVNNARRMEDQAATQKRRGILSLVAQAGPAQRQMQDFNANADINRQEGAARQAGLAQFAGSQGGVGALDPSQVQGVEAGAQAGIGPSSDTLNRLRARTIAESQRSRAGAGILGNNMLIDDRTNRQLGLLDGRLSTDQLKYAGLYQLGGLAGAVGTGVDSYGLNQLAQSRARNSWSANGGSDASGWGLGSAGFSDSRGSAGYMDPYSGQMTYPS